MKVRIRKTGINEPRDIHNKDKLIEEQKKKELHPDYPYNINEGFGKLRKWTLDNITQRKWFDYIILLAIVSNCVFLGMDDPTAPADSDLSQLLDVAEIVYLVIFTLEMLLKFISLGFLNPASTKHPGGYFKDSWNILDFIIVISSFINLFPGVTNISPLRILRVLRPLRAINNVPGLKIMVDTLLSSMRALGNVAILISFLMTIFAIMGLQLWNGVLHQRCYLETDIDFLDDSGHICSIDGPDGYECPDGYVCVSEADNPGRKLYSFDDVFQSLLTLYQNMSLTDWTKTMYMIHDSYSPFIAIFFVGLVLIMSFFAINLVLAVIFDAFVQSKEQHAHLIKHNIHIEEKKLTEEDTTKEKDIISNIKHLLKVKKEEVDQQLLNDEEKKLSIVRKHQLIREKKLELKKKQDEENERKDIEDICNEALALELEEIAWIDKYLHNKPKIILSIYNYVTNKWFDRFIIFCILANTVILAWDHYGIEQSTTDLLEIFNEILTYIFLFEMIFKLIAFGWHGYTRDNFNNFDATIVILSVFELSGIISSSGISVFRALRLLRVFKLARSLKALQILLLTVVDSLESIFYMTCLLFLFIFMFGVLGVQLFAGKFDNFDASTFTRYDNLYWSMFSVFQVLTGDDWPNVMQNAYEAGGTAAIPFMLLVHALGAYVIISLFVSVILDGFSSQNDRVFDVLDMRTIIMNKIKAGLEDDFKKTGEYSFHLPSSYSKDKYIELLIDELNKKRAKQLAAKERRLLQRKEMAKKKQMYGKSCYIWDKTSNFRDTIYNIATSPTFEWFIIIVILANCVFLAMENPYNSQNMIDIIETSDLIFTIIFLIEMILKVIALGFYFTKDSYMSDNWNRLDGFVVLVSVISLIFPSVKVLRALRAVRPIRVIIRSERVKVVVQSLWNAIPAIGNVVVFCGLFWLIFGILGVSLFGGRFWYCTDPDIQYQYQCIDTYIDENGYEMDRLWLNPPQNFDNIWRSIRTLFQVATLSSWNEVMHAAVDTTTIGQVRSKGNNEGYAIFFLLFIIICSFFTLNLFVGVVIDNFNRLKEEFEGSALLTETQRKKQKAERRIKSMKLVSDDPIPHGQYRRKLYDIVKHPKFDPFIMLCIILNCITMAMEYHGMSKTYRDILYYFNLIFVIIFSFEAAMKIIALTWKVYWKDSWNKFDFILVILSYPGYIVDTGVGLNVIRLFRIGRIFRLVKQAKELQKLFDTLVDASGALGNISVFLFSIFFIYSILAVYLFGEISYSVGGLHEHANFEYFGIALLTLFRVSTGDGWHELPNGCMVQEPFCSGGATCGNEILSSIYFNSFMIIGSLVMINLFIAVILENFSSDGDKDINDAIAEFRDVWSSYDKYASEYVMPNDFIEILSEGPDIFSNDIRNNNQTLVFQLKRLNELKMALQLNTPDKKCQSFVSYLSTKFEEEEKQDDNNDDLKTSTSSTFLSRQLSSVEIDNIIKDNKHKHHEYFMIKFKTALRILLQQASDDLEDQSAIIGKTYYHTYTSTLSYDNNKNDDKKIIKSSYIRKFMSNKSKEQLQDEKDGIIKVYEPEKIHEFIYLHEYIAVNIIIKWWKNIRKNVKKNQKKKILFSPATRTLIEYIDFDGNVYILDKDKDYQLYIDSLPYKEKLQYIADNNDIQDSKSNQSKSNNIELQELNHKSDDNDENIKDVLIHI